MAFDPMNAAVNEAAKAVRAALIRLDYVDGGPEPDGEDKAIAIIAIRTFLNAMSGVLPNAGDFSSPFE